jgi:hypothetical protein
MVTMRMAKGIEVGEERGERWGGAGERNMATPIIEVMYW